MEVRNGIFQGDALSPTLFVLSVAPISYALDKRVRPVRSASDWQAGYGFEMGHHFYMDDLKLYARNSEDLDRQVQIVSEVSEAIGLQLNLSKCTKLHYAPHDRTAEATTVAGSLEVLK
ncbi:unnamed protein product [Anisakis simplex]|uniref:Reverse transcriptase domain-containing protein n=1 Tax=Anisakis simplex TaxID=6269 RepID=A0A0M3JC00_ANISI|nr:unnamed protein product [Anisakis simplex]